MMTKIIKDGKKIGTRETVQLKLLVVEKGKTEGNWVELPESQFSDFNEYSDKNCYIERIWSNCGLILKDDICNSCDEEGNYIIDMSATLKYLNNLIIDLNYISTVEEVQAFAECGRSWDSIYAIKRTILDGNYHFFANIDLEKLVRIDLDFDTDGIICSSEEEIISIQEKIDKCVKHYRLNGFDEATTGVIHWLDTKSE